MRSVSFVVPGDPQGKGRHRTGKFGTYTPAKTVAYEGLIAHMAHEAMKGQPLLEGPLKLTAVAVFCPPKSISKKKLEAMLSGVIQPTKKPDADNIIKAIGDGCNGVVFHDDSAITTIDAAKRYGSVPCLQITIEGK
ncbi:RusA family crossover junction endodeoxyribonuclease [uncultured Brevundimonas sp.]|uniref:RusA family crossover junction endodeoxyribonuclease n=1 Tax=uncultured Brevundimonas sp. TaxID=213418 RepID=UPI00261D5136|nr:RusA family crossover junction endodeoxyribonuclease [uncultured Brevundimonas sp.]